MPDTHSTASYPLYQQRAKCVRLSTVFLLASSFFLQQSANAAPSTDACSAAHQACLNLCKDPDQHEGCRQSCREKTSSCAKDAQREANPTLRSATGIDYGTGEYSTDDDTCVTWSANGICLETEDEE